MASEERKSYGVPYAEPLSATRMLLVVFVSIPRLGRINDQIHDRDGPFCSPIPSGIRSSRGPSESPVAAGAG